MAPQCADPFIAAGERTDRQVLADEELVTVTNGVEPEWVRSTLDRYGHLLETAARLLAQQTARFESVNAAILRLAEN